MAYLELIALALALILLAALYATKRNLPPGPRGIPILGYLPWLDPKNPHLTLKKLSEKYGSIYSLQMGSVFTVVLTDVKLIRQAFALEAFCGRAPLYLTHGVMNGNGIICTQGEKWKEQRKFVTACLRNFGMVKFGLKRDKMESDIKDGLAQMIQHIREKCEDIDTEKLLMHHLGNVVFKLVFGRTWERNDPIWETLLGFQEEGPKLIGVAGPINFLPFLRVLPKYKSVIKYINHGIKVTHELYVRILEEYRSSKSNDDDEGECDQLMAAFDREMQKRKDEPGFYTLEQFNFLMADMWGAGVDTTATTLRWYFLYMASNPEIQEKVQKELDDIVGNRSVSLSDLPSLHFVQASICEVQRIRSVTPLGIPHGATEETSLAGYTIPQGAMVIPLQWVIHMNEEIYEHPEKFDPTRFLDEDGKFFKPDAFIPFQTGKRMCLGEEYARMLLFLFGAGVIQRFTLSPPDGSPLDLEGELGITFTPKKHRLNFVPRVRNFSPERKT